MTAPFTVNAALAVTRFTAPLRWEWRVVRRGRVVARCNSKRYAERIAGLLNAEVGE